MSKKEITKCPHPLGEEGLKKAYANLVKIEIHPDDIKSLIEDEKIIEEPKEIITFTDEYLDFIYENSSPIKISKENKNKKVF